MNIEEIIKNLKNRGYLVKCFEKKEEACSYLDRTIDGVSVGIGGSVTIDEIGLYEKLKLHNEVWWHNDSSLVEKYGDSYIRNKAANTDIYISSVNGMSADGEIVNIDATGNRLSSICYGHKKVYLVLGINKVTKTLEDAIWRSRNIAAPKNAQRLKRKTPCAKNGDKCYDCLSPERICRGLLIMDRAFNKVEMEIIIINESLGY